MPTITVGELRRLIASTSYDQFARDGRPQVRGRPQSSSVKRDRSRSRSRTRSHHTRPQSADKRARPQSATVVLHYRPQKPVQTTPRKRPQSANSVTCVPSHDVKKVDYTGLSNMMQSMSFKQSSARRGWKSKSVDFSEPEKKPTTKKSNKTETCDEHETKTVDMKALRNNRSSSFSKFKYPLTNQGLKQHMNRMYVEENIPASLKRLPKYSNQPRRMNCSYTPPGVSVTKVKQHSILSKTLPPPPPDLSRKPPLPPASTKKTAPSIIDTQQTNSPSKENLYVEDIQLNGTYHFVHNGQAAETVVTPIDDADFLTPREMSPRPVIVTVQETPRDSNTARLDSTRVEKLHNISEDIKKEEKESDFDKQSNASDDSFLVKDDVEDDTHITSKIFGSSSDLDKHSYGDMNDLRSVPSELSINSIDKSGVVFRAKSSSDDEIEEDIPEEVNVKTTTISFTSQMGGRSLKH